VEVRKMRFSEKLPKLRKNNNLSQEQLAEQLGVSRQAVSKWLAILIQIWKKCYKCAKY
jgi:transcriptional regulator with XRE-family HTH domain